MAGTHPRAKTYSGAIGFVLMHDAGVAIGFGAIRFLPGVVQPVEMLGVL